MTPSPTEELFVVMSKMLPDLEKYFEGLVPERSQLLEELEEQAEREGIPIVGPAVGRLLTILTKLSGGHRALELGTATGYSALFIVQGLAPGGTLVSLEHSPDIAAEARANFERAGAQDQIEVLVGDAMQALIDMEGNFDLAFLDIEKADYVRTLPHLQRLLRPGGLIVADNTGFNDAQPFNQALMQSPDWLETNLLCYLPQHSPVYDGLAMAIRI
jgi:caffeoyl-CoA O-methyltransferase